MFVVLSSSLLLLLLHYIHTIYRFTKWHCPVGVEPRASMFVYVYDNDDDYDDNVDDVLCVMMVMMMMMMLVMAMLWTKKRTILIEL